MKAIKDYIYHKSLKAIEKQVKTINRNKMVYNLTTARSVGIVFFANNLNQIELVSDFMDYFKEKTIGVKAIGFYPQKEIPANFLNTKQIDFFCKRNLNWYQKPITPIVDVFASTEYDILIDLNFEEFLPLRWISSISRAKFKVGASNYFQNPFDLIVSVDKSKGQTYLMEQILKILFQLNNRFAEEKEPNTETV